MARLHRQFTRAFTRVELLITATIVLGFILVFSDAIGNAKYNARAASCRANLKQIGLAVQSYQASHKGAMPTSLKILQPIMKSQSVFECVLSSNVGSFTRRGYNYRFLAQPNSTDIICWDSSPHHPQHSVLVFKNRDNRNVLLANGQVVNVPEEQFQRLHLQGQVWIIDQP